MKEEKIMKKLNKDGLNKFLVLYLDNNDQRHWIDSMESDGIAAAVIKKYLDDNPLSASLIKMSFEKGEIKTNPVQDALLKTFDGILQEVGC